jgi:hypothetical protein
LSHPIQDRIYFEYIQIKDSLNYKPAILESPERRNILKEYLNILTAITTIENGEKRYKAEMIIKVPPHFLTILIYLSSTLSYQNMVLQAEQA